MGKSGWNGGRFRWVTIQRALDLLEGLSNAQMVAVMEELGLGPDYDSLPAHGASAPKIRNRLSSICREEPPRTDTEGVRVDEQLVRRAARLVPTAGPFDPEPEHTGTVVAFLNSLAVDGWSVSNGILSPTTPVEIQQVRSRLVELLTRAEGMAAADILSQVEESLDAGNVELANGGLRAFLNAVFEAIARRHPKLANRNLSEGAARKGLQEVGFFKPDQRDSRKSLEGDFIQSLVSLLGSEGAHTGASDETTAVFRYGMALLVADYFLERAAGDLV